MKREESANRGLTGAKANCGGLAGTGCNDPNFGDGPRQRAAHPGAGTAEKFDVGHPVPAARRANRSRERCTRLATVRTTATPPEPGNSPTN